MKHIYNLSSAATTLQSSTSALGTALSGKIFTLLLLSFFLLVSGRSMGQTTTIYTNTFDEIGDITAQLTRGEEPKIQDGQLTVETGNGANDNKYNGWIFIPVNREFKAKQYYNLSLNVRVDGKGTNKDGVFTVKIGTSAASVVSAGTTLIPATPLVHTAFREYGSTTFRYSTDQQALVIGIFIDGSRNNSSIHFDNLAITERCTPYAPIVSNSSSCNPANLDLIATGATGGDTYIWYNSEQVPLSGGTNGTFSTGVLQENTDYYVAITNGQCTSTKVLVKALIGVANAPTVTATENCPELKVTLVASGGAPNDVYKWYTVETGGTAFAEGSQITASRANEQTLYVELVKASGNCISERTRVRIMKNNTTVSIPSAQASYRCGSGGVTLIANGAEAGESYRWYSSANSTEVIGYGEFYVTADLPLDTDVRYYVSKYNTALGCESGRLEVLARANSFKDLNDPLVGSITNPIVAAKVGDLARYEYSMPGLDPNDIANHTWHTYIVGKDEPQPGAIGTSYYEIEEMPGNIRGVGVIIKLKPNVCYTVANRGGEIEINNLSITPLPVELISFNAKRDTKGVLLTWATASELDNKGFEVQVSTDARKFTALGFVESKVGTGTTSLRQDYKFLDTKAVSGTRYYRLKQIDFDGTTSFSPVKAVVLNEGSNHVSAYPNPFDDAVVVTLNGTESRNVQVLLMDAMGKVIQQRTEETSGNSITVDTRSITTKGMYILHVYDNDTKHTFKLMKR